MSSAERIASISWSTEFGISAYFISARQEERDNTKVSALAADMFWNANVFLDGLRWKPLEAEFDYVRSWKNIRERLFAEESRIIQHRSS